MRDERAAKRSPAALLTPVWVRILSDILFAVYLALLFRLTVFRDNFSIHNFMLGGNINLTVFCDLIDLIRRGGAFYFFYLFLGNIAAFIPLGGYLAYRTGMRMAAIVLTGTAVSIAIETLQFAFAVGVTEIDDVILNTAGTLIGAAAVFLICRCHKTKNKAK